MLLVLAVSAQGQDEDAPIKKQFKILGGISAPVGDFAASTAAEAGVAQTGLALGTEFSSEVARHFILGIGVMFDLNSMDAAEIEKVVQTASGFSNAHVDAGTWDLFWFMGGAGFNAPLTSVTDLYGGGSLGLLVGISPNLTLRNGSSEGHSNSATAKSIAYGLGLGIVVDTRYDIGLRYLYGEPEYNVTSVSGSMSSTSKAKQPTSVIQFTVGLVFR
jgi:hypothetical protein